MDTFKKYASPSLRAFIEGYEPSIRDLFSEAKNKGFLIESHSREEIERNKKFIRTSNAPLHLLNNVDRLINNDHDKWEKLKKTLMNNEQGYKLDNDGEQAWAIYCLSYQVLTERLKFHLVTLIDFNKLKLNNAHKQKFGRIINVLKTEFKSNKFIDFLDTGIRNAVAHYTYYFEEGHLWLCNGYSDPVPRKISLLDFMKEIMELNALTESIFLVYLDMFRPDGDLIRDS